MEKTPKCHFCNHEAIWAMQFIAERKPTFYALGWHIRGFSVTKVCDDHFNLINDAWQKLGEIETTEEDHTPFELFLIGLS